MKNMDRKKVQRETLGTLMINPYCIHPLSEDQFWAILVIFILGVIIGIIIRNILHHHQLFIQMGQHQELMVAELIMNKTQLLGKNTIRNITNIMANILKVIYLSPIR